MHHETSVISVIGLGYIGLPTAAMFASHQKTVIGVDINEDTVATINQGKIHIVEPDLDVAVRSAVTAGYLRAATTPEPADAFLMAVPTPFHGANHDPDLSYIEAAAGSLAPVLRPGNLVVLESTSPVGSTEQLAKWLAEARPDLSFPQTAGADSDIRIAHCPERVLPGQVMKELVDNDRVIGGITPACSAAAVALYKIFVKGECVVTSARTAEMAKLTENSFRDVNIAFANELSIICDELEIDVWELISLANRHPRVNILQPGPGVGGHCIAVDPWFIISKTPKSARLIRSAREVNDAKPHWVLQKVKEALSRYVDENPGKTARDACIACYGLAFKPDIDDLRQSPAVEIVKAIARDHKGRTLVVEPHINSMPGDLASLPLYSQSDAREAADIHLLLVDHSEFREKERPVGIVIDTKSAWRPPPAEGEESQR